MFGAAKSVVTKKTKNKKVKFTSRFKKIKKILRTKNFEV